MVNNEDVVLHLGDLALGHRDKIIESVKLLKGQKFLIKGNHDRYSNVWIEKFGFHPIKRDIEVRVDGKLFIFGHRPINPIYVNHSEPFINIHGHWHNKSSFIYKRDDRIGVNCSVELIGYKPIKFSKILELLKGY